MNVLSCFDGIACGRVALRRAKIKVDRYFASEVDPIAIQIAKKRNPDIIHIGDISKVHYTNLGLEVDKNNSSMDVYGHKIDLIIGGSPCQGLSFVGKRLNFEDPRSKLFFEFARIVKSNPEAKFLLENVRMDQKSKDVISQYLGVQPIEINSNLVSYQNRSRLYWTNIEGVEPPKDRNIDFQNYIETDDKILEEYAVKYTPSRVKMWLEKCPNVTYRKKINCITLKQDRWSNSGLVEYRDFCRYLTTRELELGQTLPVGYCNGVNKFKASELIGNGFTVDVIAHILSFI